MLLSRISLCLSLPLSLSFVSLSFVSLSFVSLSFSLCISYPLPPLSECLTLPYLPSSKALFLSIYLSIPISLLSFSCLFLSLSNYLSFSLSHSAPVDHGRIPQGVSRMHCVSVSPFTLIKWSPFHITKWIDYI